MNRCWPAYSVSRAHLDLPPPERPDFMEPLPHPCELRRMGDVTRFRKNKEFYRLPCANDIANWLTEAPLDPGIVINPLTYKSYTKRDLSKGFLYISGAMDKMTVYHRDILEHWGGVDHTRDGTHGGYIISHVYIIPWSVRRKLKKILK